MSSEAGPSYTNRPPARRNSQGSSRGGPSRYDPPDDRYGDRDRDDWGRPYDSGPRGPGPWTRQPPPPPPRAGYRPGPVRSRTPSPPRRLYDREFDRGRHPRDIEWERERQAERNWERARDRDRDWDRPPPFRDRDRDGPPNYADRRPPYPPPQGRDIPKIPPWEARDRRRDDRFPDDRIPPYRRTSPSKSSRGSSPIKNRNSSPTKRRPAPRGVDSISPIKAESVSMTPQGSSKSSPGGVVRPSNSTETVEQLPERQVRAGSSPVEILHHRTLSPEMAPVVETSNRPTPASAIKKERIDLDLEEGEVLSSPVRPEKTLNPPTFTNKQRWPSVAENRDRPPVPSSVNTIPPPLDRRDKRWRSPPKRGRTPPFSPVSQAWREGRSIDDGWGNKRRTSEDEKADASREEGTSPNKERITPIPKERPSTPPLPASNDVGNDSPSRVPQEIVPELQIDRPDTPAFEGLSAQTDPQMSSTAEVEKLLSAKPSSVFDSTEQADLGSSSIRQETLIDKSPVLPSSVDVKQDHSASNFPNTDTPIVNTATASDITPKTPPASLKAEEALNSPFPPPASRNRSPPPTIAERRSVQLPPTQNPLSSPFGEKTPRKDPVPTMESVQESTDTEMWPRTADLDDVQSEVSETALEAMREQNLFASIKAVQKKVKELDVDSILAWNLAAAPIPSSRDPGEMTNQVREKRIRQITWPLEGQQSRVGRKVTRQIIKEQDNTEDRIVELQKEYKLLDEEWREHCQLLDDLMEKRGPPPESLYAIPNAIPIIAPPPGPIPTTPLAEDTASRAMRRRGAGDAVTTEAEFQEILALMADTASKDPSFRASKTTAVVPDMLPVKERKLFYKDENDLIDDPIAFYDFKGNAEEIWTDEERQIFLRRYLNFPKLFGKIAEALPNKSASDCVLYYYRTKKEVDYKSMLASRRGITKKKPTLPPIKKGGKGAALLASLDQKKNSATISQPPVRAAASMMTPAKQKDESNMKKGKSHKGDASTAKKRISDVNGNSETPSRDGSEVPTLSKSKMRMSVKAAKRPRVSSVSSTQPPTPGIQAHPPLLSTGAALYIPPAPNSLDPVAAQAELLPPVKRARKSRKSTIDSDNQSVMETVLTPDGALEKGGGGRRGNTSSYWSVDEKKKLKHLLVIHGKDLKALTANLPGKSERQISNFVQGHAIELGVDLGPESSLTGLPLRHDEYFKSTLPAAYSRSIYDIYAPPMSGAPFQPSSEPRLGIFPQIARPASNPPSQPTPSLSTVASRPIESPIRNISRPGGMRISALLNDDPIEEPIRGGGVGGTSGGGGGGGGGGGAVDAQSDGTVDDRDDNPTRPSPRDSAPLPIQRRLSNQFPSEYRHTLPYSKVPLYQPSPAWSSNRRSEEYYTGPGRPSTVIPTSSSRPAWENNQSSQNYTHHYPHPAPAPHLPPHTTHPHPQPNSHQHPSVTYYSGGPYRSTPLLSGERRENLTSIAGRYESSAEWRNYESHPPPPPSSFQQRNPPAHTAIASPASKPQNVGMQPPSHSHQTQTQNRDQSQSLPPMQRMYEREREGSSERR